MATKAQRDEATTKQVPVAEQDLAPARQAGPTNVRAWQANRMTLGCHKTGSRRPCAGAFKPQGPGLPHSSQLFGARPTEVL